MASRQIRRRATITPLLVVGSAVLAVALIFSAAACSGDTTSTTVTTGSVQPEETTTTGLPGELTTSTEPVGGDTTTTTTAEAGDTTTTSETAGTTTTEKLSTAETRLPNGHIKAMGFIKEVHTKDGQNYISIDYAEMLSGQEAIDAAIAAGDLAPGEDLPNDYYIRNTNPELREFAVSPGVAITTSTWEGEFDKPVTWDVFASFWSASPPGGAEFLRDSPWWIERDGQTVIKIDEQYLP